MTTQRGELETITPTTVGEAPFAAACKGSTQLMHNK